MKKTTTFLLAVLLACILSAQSAFISNEHEPGTKTHGLSNAQSETAWVVNSFDESSNTNHSKSKSYVCDSEFTDPRDGNTYPIVQIGLRCWMAKNLSYLPAVSPANQGSMTDPFYYVYDYQGTNVASAKATANFQNYGVLYNWPASLTACPEGWHLPTQSEWIALTNLLGGAAQAGGKLKSTTTSPGAHPRWTSPNTGATNVSGFSAFPGGLRTYYGFFDYIGSYGNFWSATGDSQDYSWYRQLGYNAVHVGQHIDIKSNGFSVRCLWNESLQGYLPTVSTAAIGEITSSTAVSGGNISDDGGTPVTMRGVVWSTSVNPTIDNNSGMTEDGNGTGEFISNLSGLDPETEYFIRAYATNNEGTAYGGELSFTTTSDVFTCGDIFTDHRDGKQYSTLLLGEQCWMAENLNIGTRIDGTTQQTNNATIEKYCYNNSEANCDVFGGLYQWDEIMNYTTTEGVRGICPTGWSLPTDADWETLSNYVGSQPAYLCNNNYYDIAKALAATTLWNPSTGICHVGNNLAANNATGFTGLPGGYRETDGEFYYKGNSVVFWSSTENSSSDALYRLLYYWSSNLHRIFDDKNYGHYVRCLRDEPQTYLPTVITSDVANITGNSANCGGSVTDDGGFAVSTRGVVWSTLENPTIEINEGISYDGNGTGEFISNLSGLDPETEYFVRAYATNDEGTAYGGELSFTTSADVFTCGDIFTDERDGKQYATVQIGDQCWMAQNLAYLPVVSPPSEGSYVDPLYYVYGYNGYSTVEAAATQNYQTYGALYNWAAASTACPQGWYLPTDDDWKILEANADSQYDIGDPAWDIASWRGFDVGKNLKTTVGWDNYTGTDLVDFSALPGGYRHISGDFLYLTQSGVWWTSSENIAGASWSRYLNSYYDQSYRYWDDKSFGFSVRCLMNQSQTYLPTVITSEVTNIAGNTARCGGIVTDDGGAATTRGLVWNIYSDPTIDDYEGISYNGNGIGSFTSYLTYLSPETQYYVRAYATNSVGTSYGEQHVFETTSEFDDWSLHEVTLYNTAEAEIVHRTGDIDNLGFGWPAGFNPFSGEETPWHAFPFYPDPYDPDGTDRIMVISGYTYQGGFTDGYTATTQRPENLPRAIEMMFNTQSVIIQSVAIQLFVDDFQRGVFGNNYFQVSINNVRIPILESVINSLDQTGPIGKLITVQIPESFIYLFEDGEVSLLIDDPVNNVGDGFAIDFVRLLINPGNYQNTGTIYGYIFNSNNDPIEGATVTASGIVSDLSDADGYYELLNVPAGLVYVSASKSDYNTVSGLVDLIEGTSVSQDFVLTPLLPLCEALDNCDLIFQTGGTLPWFAQEIISFDLQDAAQSGAIQHNGYSWFETIVEGPGTLTFYWKVSSEENYDYLNFYIGGVMVDQMSGEVDWHYKEFGIPAGYYALTWWYTKDGSVSNYQDAGWVDQVVYTPSQLPDVLHLSGDIIPPDPGGCFAATDLITVSNFTVMDGGNATLVVGPGGSIRLLEATKVQSGGYFRAWVDVLGNYCNQPESMIAVKHETVPEKPVIKTGKNTADFFKAYPNPTSGILLLELQSSEPANKIQLEIFNALGKRISSYELNPATNWQLDLSPLPAGLYILRLVQAGQMGTAKILKQ